MRGWILVLLAGCSHPGALADAGSGSSDDAAGDAAQAPALAYPRIASYFIESYVDDASRDVMARSDLVIVDAESAALDRTPLDALRAANPNAAVLAYLTSEEIPRQPSAEQPLATQRLARIASHEWLLEPGSTLSAAVTATATKLTVADGTKFTLHRPPSDFYDATEPTYVLVDDEHMKITAISGNQLTVQRGFQAPAAAHAAGARVASHVVFFAGTWMLDLADTAPAPGGRSWRDDLADEAAGLVASGPWTGVFLDVCFSDLSWLNNGLLDLDRDGVADDPAAVSAHWSAGFGMLVDAVRAKVGPNVPIIANPGAEDCPHPALDGILMEGWPIGMPPDYLDYATGAARYASWSTTKPLTIANGFSPKIGFGTIGDGDDAIAQADYAAMRFGLASALLGDGMYTFDNGVFGHYVAWWYDEYDGAGRGAHWLGAPRGPAMTAGAVQWREFEHGLAVVNTGAAAATFMVPDGFAKLAGTQDPIHNDGQPVTGTLAIAASDAYVLVRR
jgi:hypothetical protein